MFKSTPNRILENLNLKQRMLLYHYFELRNKKRRKLRLGKIGYFYHPPTTTTALVYGMWEMRYVNQPFADRDQKKILDFLNFIELEPKKVILFYLILGLLIIFIYPPKFFFIGLMVFNNFFPRFINFAMLIIAFYMYPLYPLTFFLYFL